MTSLAFYQVLQSLVNSYSFDSDGLKYKYIQKLWDSDTQGLELQTPAPHCLREQNLQIIVKKIPLFSLIWILNSV